MNHQVKTRWLLYGVFTVLLVTLAQGQQDYEGSEEVNEEEEVLRGGPWSFDLAGSIPDVPRKQDVLDIFLKQLVVKSRETIDQQIQAMNITDKKQKGDLQKLTMSSVQCTPRDLEEMTLDGEALITDMDQTRQCLANKLYRYKIPEKNFDAYMNCMRNPLGNADLIAAAKIQKKWIRNFMSGLGVEKAGAEMKQKADSTVQFVSSNETFAAFSAPYQDWVVWKIQCAAEDIYGISPETLTAISNVTIIEQDMELPEYPAFIELKAAAFFIEASLFTFVSCVAYHLKF